MNVPVLVSKRSGLAELLERYAPEVAPSLVVDVVDNKRADTNAWSDALEAVLIDRDAAFARAKRLREILVDKLSWERAVNLMVEKLYLMPAVADRLSALKISR